MAKKRLDILLKEKKYFPSRQRAQGAIMAGLVLVDGKKVEKAGTQVSGNATIEILDKGHSYVSRGGLKLERALDDFQINVRGKVVMDIGASTGGFTDCALQNGAKKVYAVDVGYGQLDWKLRQNNQVIVLERTNIRHLKTERITDKIDFICIDVSFISLKKVLPKANELLSPSGEIAALIKPQFEAGPDLVSKGGLVKDPQVHQNVLRDIIDFAIGMGLVPLGLTFSPITGAKGNREYLLHMNKEGKVENKVTQDIIKEVVGMAWREL